MSRLVTRAGCALLSLAVAMPLACTSAGRVRASAGASGAAGHGAATAESGGAPAMIGGGGQISAMSAGSSAIAGSSDAIGGAGSSAIAGAGPGGVGAATGTAGAPSSGANVLTHHNDNQRTGANLHETLLTTSNVNVDHFGKLYEWPVDGDLYAQPLFVSNVATSSGIHDVVYAVTMHNTLFAFDASSPSKIPLWMVDLGLLGSPIPVSEIVGLDVQPGPIDIATEIGVLSTPVIDSASNTLYLVARSLDASVHHQKLHALDLATGGEKFGGPIEISATVPGTGAGSVNGQLTFDPVVHNQRAALLLAGGNVYVTWAGHNDSNDYHGWIMAFDASTLQRTAAFVSTPNGEWAGIWQTGAGPAADASNNVYVETGNGTFNAGSQNYGESVLKLSLSGNSLQVVSSFTPKNQTYLNSIDLDLGSSGFLLLPGTHYGVAGSKEGKLYLLDTANLGGYDARADRVVDEFQATPLAPCDPHCVGDQWKQYYHIHATPVFWNGASAGPMIYVWAERDSLKSFRFLTDHLEHTPLHQSPMPAPPGMPGGFLAISANGSAAGSGIVWALHPVSVSGSATDAANEHGDRVRGILQAFDAADVSKELYNSRMNASRDDFGNFAKFNVPTIANGKVFVPTMSKSIAVFGLR